LPPILEPYNYTASTIITSIVGYNTGIDFDIYYCNNYNSSTLYKSTNGFCFNEGTKILCMKNQLKDEYIAIELLQVGNFVKTYKHGYRRVSKVIKGTFRNNSKKWNMCMYKMAKTPTNGLIEDLIVTGGHSILVDAISEEEQKKYDEMRIPSFSKLTIDNKHLLLSCCSDQFTPMQDNNRYNYYHLLLENNDDEEERFGIWANGILTETPNVKTVK
jgi:Rad3-related DNA helicase